MVKFDRQLAQEYGTEGGPSAIPVETFAKFHERDRAIPEQQPYVKWNKKYEHLK